MSNKPLYILISNGGDGSYYPQYTFNTEWIKTQEQRDDFDYEYDLGVDGDGFHYDTLFVPEHLTLKDLGISFDCAEDND